MKLPIVQSWGDNAGNIQYEGDGRRGGVAPDGGGRIPATRYYWEGVQKWRHATVGEDGPLREAADVEMDFAKKNMAERMGGMMNYYVSTGPMGERVLWRGGRPGREGEGGRGGNSATPGGGMIGGVPKVGDTSSTGNNKIVKHIDPYPFVVYR